MNNLLASGSLQLHNCLIKWQRNAVHEVAGRWGDGSHLAAGRVLWKEEAAGGLEEATLLFRLAVGSRKGLTKFSMVCSPAGVFDWPQLALLGQEGKPQLCSR